VPKAEASAAATSKGQAISEDPYFGKTKSSSQNSDDFWLEVSFSRKDQIPEQAWL
jgi:hypothetical protein